jgi:hypothetical protein
MNNFSGIFECWIYLFDIGFTTLFKGYSFFLTRVIIKSVILKLLEFKISTIKENDFWRKTMIEFITTLIIYFITYPLLTLQVKSQKLQIQQFEFSVLMNGIYFVPLIVLIETVFKNMFESVVKFYFNFKFSDLPF